MHTSTSTSSKSNTQVLSYLSESIQCSVCFGSLQLKINIKNMFRIENKKVSKLEKKEERKSRLKKPSFSVEDADKNDGCSLTTCLSSLG